MYSNPPPYWECNPDNYLFEDSILYQFLLKDYPVRFYKNIIVDEQTYIDICKAHKPKPKLVIKQEDKSKDSQ